jgi:hypothetical protein
MTRRRAGRHQALAILALTPVLLAPDALAWLLWVAWHLMPYLLAVAAVVTGLVWLARRLPEPACGHCGGSGYCPLTACRRCQHTGDGGDCAACAGTGRRP